MLAKQFVDFERQLLAVALDHHHHPGFAVVAPAKPIVLVHGDERQVFATHAKDARLPRKGTDVAALRLQRFQHVGQRQDQSLPRDRDAHAVKNRQGQRQPDHYPGTLAGAALQLYFAAHSQDVAAHYVHANAPAGQIGDRISGGKAGLEEEVPDLRIGRAIRYRQAFFKRLGQDAVAVETGAVVAHFDHDVPTLVGSGQGDRAGGILAGIGAGLRHFQAVVDAVAHQVHQRVGDALYQSLVQFRVLTHHAQPHLLAQARGKVAHQARKASEHRVHRQHAHADDSFLQVAGIALQQVEPGEQALALNWIQQAGNLLEHGLGDHQFANQVDQAVDLVDADPDRGFRRFGSRACLGAGSGGHRSGVACCLDDTVAGTLAGADFQLAVVLHPGEGFVQVGAWHRAQHAQVPGQVGLQRIHVLEARQAVEPAGYVQRGQALEFAQDA